MQLSCLILLLVSLLAVALATVEDASPERREAAAADPQFEDENNFFRVFRSMATSGNGKPSFIRFGKRAGPSFIRFGKRASPSFIRFGRSSPDLY